MKKSKLNPIRLILLPLIVTSISCNSSEIEEQNGNNDPNVIHGKKNEQGFSARLAGNIHVVEPDPSILTSEEECASTSAYDCPEQFISSVYLTIEEAKSTKTNYSYYVSIGREAYLADRRGSRTTLSFLSCPWKGYTWNKCPFGDDSNGGTTPSTGFATFKKALQAMHEKRANDHESYFFLYIRGGDFVYRQPLIIGGDMNFGTLMGTYQGPWSYNDEGSYAKKDSDGDACYDDSSNPDCDVYEDINNVYTAVSDITVEPYNDESVVIDGGCSFTYGTAEDGNELNPDHSDWQWGDSPMHISCDETVCSEKDVEDYAAHEFFDNKTTLLHVTDIPGHNYDFCTSRGMIQITAADRVEVKNIEVRNAPAMGIYVQSRNRDVIIEGNNVNNTYNSGIASHYINENIIITNNSISYANASSNQENLSIETTEKFAVFGNTIHDGWQDEHICTSDSVDGYIADNEIYGDSGTGVYVASGSSQIRIDANNIRDITYNACITITTEDGDTISDIIISNNLCYNNYTGIWLSGLRCDLKDETTGEYYCDNVGTDINNVYVVNNTVYGNGTLYVDPDHEDTFGVGFRINNPDAHDIIVANNIFAENLTAQLQIDDTSIWDSISGINPDIMIFENNITYCSHYLVSGVYGADNYNEDGCRSDMDSVGINEDPKLIDQGNGDFHLDYGSPAISAGTLYATAGVDVNAPSNDYEDNDRFGPLNFNIDIGAYERDSDYTIFFPLH